MVADDDDSNPFPERLTLSFDGPPLRLPGESDAAPAPASAEAPQRISERPSRALSDSTPADAWTKEHRARSSTHPPMSSWIPAPSLKPRASDVPPPPADAPPSSDDALQLVDRQPPGTPGLHLHDEMTDRYALGDFTAALQLAELLLGRNPEDEVAQRYARNSREQLEQFYLATLGSDELVMRVAVPEQERLWLGLDNQAEVLLRGIDGERNLADVVRLSGLPRLEALKALAELADIGVLALPRADER